jgi:hypothetical protein
MHMSKMDHRLHLLLDETRYRKLAREARRRGTSVAGVVREAIDQLTIEDQRREAIEAILAAPPSGVPNDPAELRRELDAAHDRLP